jgi:hypothetical protein
MNIKKYYLKVKAKSLAEEARIIRKEEQKVKRIPWDRRRNSYKYFGRTVFTDPVDGLVNHRKWDVRNEARATHLARAFMKGQKYKQVEPHCKEPHKRDYYILPRVTKIVAKYGGNSKITKDVIKTWVDGYENT